MLGKFVYVLFIWKKKIWVDISVWVWLCLINAAIVLIKDLNETQS